MHELFAKGGVILSARILQIRSTCLKYRSGTRTRDSQYMDGSHVLARGAEALGGGLHAV